MWPVQTLVAVGVAVVAVVWGWRERRALIEARRTLAERRAELASLQSGQQEAAREAESERATLFNSMSEGVLLLDAGDRVRFVNRACESLFGLATDVRGRTVLEAFRLHELHELVQRVKTEARVVGHELELRGVAASSLEVNAASLRNGGGQPQGLIFVFHDLTRLKQLETARKEFVANVSHELRTPLAMIKGYVETLIDGAKDDPAVALRFLQTIEKHADRLTYLIEDLLTLSRLESGGVVLNLERVEVRRLAERVVEDLADRAAQRGVRLRCDVADGLVARVDADRVVQVLFNLVDNAIKYGRPDGEVIVGGRQENDRSVELWIHDDGPGIPADSLDRIFERFYRVDKARSRDQGGTGLGLAIVRHIVQHHGGQVRVSSQPGEGTTFAFTLPAATDAAS